MIYEKDPDEVLDYPVDWTDYLDDVGDSLETSDWQIPDGLTLNAASVETSVIINGVPAQGTFCVAWLSGGTVGELYKITNHITTTSTPSRVVERSHYIRIVEH